MHLARFFRLLQKRFRIYGLLKAAILLELYTARGGLTERALCANVNGDETDLKGISTSLYQMSALDLVVSERNPEWRVGTGTHTKLVWRLAPSTRQRLHAIRAEASEAAQSVAAAAATVTPS